MRMQIALITVMLFALVTCDDQDHDQDHDHHRAHNQNYDQDKAQQRYNHIGRWYNKVSGCKSNCHSRRSPRCGSNGVTYLNRCHLQNAKCDDPSIRMVSRGTCPESAFYRQESNVILCLNTNANSDSDSGEQPMFIRCIEITNNGGGNAEQIGEGPGPDNTDGVTCPGGIDGPDGSCTTDVSPPIKNGDRVTPVSGTSQYQPVGTTAATQPKLSTENVCNERCPSNGGAPVCGSDGITYPNECILDSTRCSGNPNLQKIADGPCPERPPRGDI